MWTAIAWAVIVGVLLLYGYSIYKRSIKGVALALIVSVIALLATTSTAFVITTALGLLIILVMAAFKLSERNTKPSAEK
ncbi:MAG: hypothetical protein WC958_03980 [Dehalococcoidales bacterium]|jgi:hypothetical protein